MKVNELIEYLKKQNENMEVMYWDAEEGRYYPAIIDKINNKFLEIDREG